MPIYFYSTRADYGCFSNFSYHAFELDGEYWSTTEHYFQSQKFNDAEHQEKIRTARTPKDSKTLGLSRQFAIRSDWQEAKDEIMFEACLKKFQTHKTLKELLLSTGEEELIEAAPMDYYWGCGENGTGQNKLGRILERVREQLRES